MLIVTLVERTFNLGLISVWSCGGRCGRVGGYIEELQKPLISLGQGLGVVLAKTGFLRQGFLAYINLPSYYLIINFFFFLAVLFLLLQFDLFDQ